MRAARVLPPPTRLPSTAIMNTGGGMFEFLFAGCATLCEQLDSMCTPSLIAPCTHASCAARVRT
ncbi:hypothetical protein EON67_02550 [archaeon]|nr:MAG: hypothetical protein EON67_02550 [archaeon]